jgi:hypothetical protein
LEGQAGFGRLILGLSQDVQLLAVAIWTGQVSTRRRSRLLAQSTPPRMARLTLSLYETNFSGSYDLSDKTFISGGVIYRRQDFNTLISSDEFSGNLFFNYKYSPRLAFGIGGSGGYRTTDLGPDETFEQGFCEFNIKRRAKSTSTPPPVSRFGNSTASTASARAAIAFRVCTNRGDLSTL